MQGKRALGQRYSKAFVLSQGEQGMVHWGTGQITVDANFGKNQQVATWFKDGNQREVAFTWSLLDLATTAARAARSGRR